MRRPTRQTHTLRTWSILGACVLAGAILVSQVFSTPARAATDGIPPSGNCGYNGTWISRERQNPSVAHWCSRYSPAEDNPRPHHSR